MSAANLLFILAVWGPNLAALIVTAASSGGAGMPAACGPRLTRKAKVEL